MLPQPAVTLLPRLNKPVAAHWTPKQRARFVAQTIIHAVLKRHGQVLQTAGGPEVPFHGGGGGTHDALLLRTLAVGPVVVHPKVMAHLVGHGDRHDADDLAVPDANSARKFVCAHWTLNISNI